VLLFGFDEMSTEPKKTMYLTIEEIQSELEQFCQKALPAKRNLQLSDFHRIEMGWECEIYTLEATYIENEQYNQEGWILKMYPPKGNDHKSEREFNNMKQIAQTGYLLPEAILQASENSPFGQSFVVMERIGGYLLGEVLAEPDTQKELIIKSFCEKFIELHTLDWLSVVSDPHRYLEIDFDRLIKQRIVKLRAIFRYAFLSQFDPIFDWLLTKSEGIKQGRLSIVHTDYHPWNILLQADGRLVVIDWGSAEVSDFRFDLGCTLMLMEAFVAPAMRDVTLSEYRQIASYPVECIEFFEVMAGLKHLFEMIEVLKLGARAVGRQPVADSQLRENPEYKQRIYAMLCHRTGIDLPEVETMLTTLP
jgi:aminoglycoside phosphotransferase (APT) family kinase protein